MCKTRTRITGQTRLRCSPSETTSRRPPLPRHSEPSLRRLLSRSRSLRPEREHQGRLRSPTWPRSSRTLGVSLKHPNEAGPHPFRHPRLSLLLYLLLLVQDPTKPSRCSTTTRSNGVLRPRLSRSFPHRRQEGPPPLLRSRCPLCNLDQRRRKLLAEQDFPLQIWTSSINYERF